MTILASTALGLQKAPDPVQHEKALKKSVVVDAPVAEVYKAWSTKEGLESFLCPQAVVELRCGGRYEIHFMKDAPVGLRGAEGTQVLSFIPNRMLSISWNAPPQFPTARSGPKTFVVIEFAEAGTGKTRVDFTHGGWPAGKVYEEVYAYFDKAWDFVLGQLKLRFEQGPRKFESAPAANGEPAASPGVATLKKMERFIGGTWKGVLPGPEKVEVEFRYFRHPDGKGIMSQGVIGVNKEKKTHLHVMFGIDPINGEAYYLDTHDSGTVYYGWTVLDKEDLVFLFGPAGGDSGRFSSRGRFVDDDTYQTIIQTAKGEDIVGFTLKRER